MKFARLMKHEELDSMSEEQKALIKLLTQLKEKENNNAKLSYEEKGMTDVVTYYLGQGNAYQWLAMLLKCYTVTELSEAKW